MRHRRDESDLTRFVAVSVLLHGCLALLLPYMPAGGGAGLLSLREGGVVQVVPVFSRDQSTGTGPGSETPGKKALSARPQPPKGTPDGDQKPRQQAPTRADRQTDVPVRETVKVTKPQPAPEPAAPRTAAISPAASAGRAVSGEAPSEGSSQQAVSRGTPVLTSANGKAQVASADGSSGKAPAQGAAGEGQAAASKAAAGGSDQRNAANSGGGAQGKGPLGVPQGEDRPVPGREMLPGDWGVSLSYPKNAQNSGVGGEVSLAVRVDASGAVMVDEQQVRAKLSGEAPGAEQLVNYAVRFAKTLPFKAVGRPYRVPVTLVFSSDGYQVDYRLGEVQFEKESR